MKQKIPEHILSGSQIPRCCLSAKFLISTYQSLIYTIIFHLILTKPFFFKSFHKLQTEDAFIIATGQTTSYLSGVTSHHSFGDATGIYHNACCSLCPQRSACSSPNATSSPQRLFTFLIMQVVFSCLNPILDCTLPGGQDPCLFISHFITST